MSEQYSVEWRGLGKVMRNLDKPHAQKALVTGIEWGMDRVAKELMKYPPETYRNKPHTVDGVVRWYERGLGTHVGGSVRRTSEDLKRKWRPKMQAVGAKIQGVLRNIASYSGWVHGKYQAKLMAKIGWPKARDTALEFMPKIERVILDNFHKRWGK